MTHPQTYPQTHRPTKPLLILDISNIFPHSTYSIFRLASMHTKHMYLQTSFHLQYYSTLYTFKLRSDFMHSIHMHLQTIFRRQYFSTLCAIKPKHRSMHLIHMYSQIILRRRYISTRFAYKLHYSSMLFTPMYSQIIISRRYIFTRFAYKLHYFFMHPNIMYQFYLHSIFHIIHTYISICYLDIPFKQFQGFPPLLLPCFILSPECHLSLWG